jgi:UDP-N-acetylglucosamine 2-epimerase (non-hydrolysing)
LTKILFVLGTRPEAIKLYPLINQFKENPLKFEIVVLSTGQQKELLNATLSSLLLKPDFELSLMEHNQDLSGITSLLFLNIDKLVKEIGPDYLFIHGDTTTSMVAGIVAKYNKVKSFHVEAGLRTFDLMSPWPEEMNRRINAITSDFHIAPTFGSLMNLINEGVDKRSVFVSGNTGIDTLRIVSDTVINMELNINELLRLNNPKLDIVQSRIVLVTIHRRENFGSLKFIFNALKLLANRNSNFIFVFPVHLNPNVQTIAYEVLEGIDNVVLTKPVEYKEFVLLLKACNFVITDSGGIQEEAAYLGKPVVLCRNKTERPEGLDSMNIIVAGTDETSIFDVSQKLIDNKNFYKQHSNPTNVFGDGFASIRIYEWFCNLKQLS